MTETNVTIEGPKQSKPDDQNECVTTETTETEERWITYITRFQNHSVSVATDRYSFVLILVHGIPISINVGIRARI